MDTYGDALLHVGGDAATVEAAVAKSELSLGVTSVDTVAKAVSVLEETAVTGLVTETQLPDGTGIDLIESVVDTDESTPVLLITRDPEMRVKAIDAGVSDVYLTDGDTANPAVLGHRLDSVFETQRTLLHHAGLVAETALLVDADGEIVMTGSGGKRLVNADSPTALVGRQLSALVTERDGDRVETAVKRLSDGTAEAETLGVSFETGGVTVPGELRLSAVHGGEDGRRLLVTATDTQRSGDDRTSVPLTDRLLDTIDDVFYLLDPGQNLLRWNEQLSAVTGYSDDEIAEMGPLEFFIEDDREAVAATIAEILETGSGSVEATMVTKHGDEIPFEYTGVALTGPDGTTRGAAGIGREISDRKKRERELRRYETITEALGDPVYALDTDGSYTYVNDAFLEQTGYERSEVLGSHVSKVLTDEEIERGRAVIRELLADETKTSARWEMTRTMADGESVPTENNTALLPLDDDGQFQGSVGVIRDISERVQRERDLQRERDRLQSVFDASPHPVVHVSLETGEPTVMAVNEAFEETFGVDPAEVVGSSPSSDVLTATESTDERTVYDQMREGGSVSREVTRTVADGSDREFLFKSSTLRRNDGTVEGLAAYVDITERNRRVELLEQIKQNVTEVIWMTDIEKNTMEFVSDAYESVWGRSTESLLAAPESFVDAIHPADRDRVETALEVQQTEPEQYEETYRIQQPDGEVRWVRDRSSGVYEDGELKRVVGIASDITEQKERERELRLKNRVMDEAPIGITIHDATVPDCPVIYANDGFEEVTGYGSDTIDGKQLSTLAGAETAESDLAELETAVEGGQSTSLALLLYREDGVPFWGRISLAPVVDDSGETTHFVGFLQDITKTKEREQEIARRLEEFGELLAEDLRVPVERAQTELTSAATDDESLDAAQQSLERVEGLLDDLVAVHTQSVTSREVGDLLQTQIEARGGKDE